ncbi:MAG: hypothetical protein LBO09_03380 [Candidatus Peribacteria bacterium]|nr:hypothetical protein [Candidatus Peribacteria bacterium]
MAFHDSFVVYQLFQRDLAMYCGNLYRSLEARETDLYRTTNKFEAIL